MTDDLNDLKRALDAATPAPDAAKKAAVLARAQENFATSQGSRAEARQSSNQSRFKGVLSMFTALNTRATFGATTALVAVGAVILIPWQDALTPAPTLPEPVVLEAEPVLEESFAADMASPKVMTREVAPQALSRQSVARSAAPSAATGAVTLDQPILRPLPAPLPDRIITEADTEAFPKADTNPLKVTAETPVSTFSIDVDTASYALLRNSIGQGRLPQPDTLRIEEMINYFPYDYAAPQDAPFAVNLAAMQTPWNPGTQLVRIGLQGALPAVEDRPPLNLVFLIDTSGSMNQPNKLPLLKQSLSLMLSELRPEDEIAIVTYAGSAGEVLKPTPAAERATILSALDRLAAGGSTAGQAGLQQAYATAEAMTADGEVSRILLATDGDFNVGLSDPDRLKDFIAEKRDTGTYLSVLGFGRGNLDDATMQALAQNGNGTAAYIDTLSEAQKVLVDQLTGALFPIANDVKIQVEWNPATVSEYRLIGYETRALNREDFNNDKVDAGEIGAGHQVTALYEITPVGSASRLTDPLRYGTETPVATTDELGFLRLRYKAPGEDESQLIERPITSDLDGDTDLTFAAAIAGFGQQIRGATYLGDWGWDEAIALANAAKGEDPFGYRAEAIRLMRLAASIDR